MNIIQMYLILYKHFLFRKINGNTNLVGQDSDEIIQKCFRVLKRRDKSWTNSSVNLANVEVYLSFKIHIFIVCNSLNMA